VPFLRSTPVVTELRRSPSLRRHYSFLLTVLTLQKIVTSILSEFTAFEFSATALWALSIAAEVVLLLVFVVGYWLTGRSKEDDWSRRLPPDD